MNLPEPAERPQFALFTGSEGVFYLAYELPRDFLSTPRQFAIVVGSLGTEGQLAWLQGRDLQRQADCADVEDEAVAESDEPFFQQGDAAFYLHLANGQQQLHLGAGELRLLCTVFNSEGPESALLASLGSELTG